MSGVINWYGRNNNRIYKGYRNNPNLYSIPAGTYTVEETYAPEGYYNDRQNISARVITASTVTATKLDKDGKFIKETSLSEIRNRLHNKF